MATGHRNGAQQIRRSVCADVRRVAHGAGHDDGSIAPHEQVEREGDLLEGIGTLGHHGAVGAVFQVLAHVASQSDDVVQAQVTRRDAQGGDDVNLNVVERPNDRVQQVLGPQLGHHASPVRDGGGSDRPAQRDQRHSSWSHAMPTCVHRPRRSSVTIAGVQPRRTDPRATATSRSLRTDRWRQRGEA